MQRAGTRAAGQASIVVVRWLLVIPLILAIAGHLWVLRWTLGEPDQAAIYYAVNALVDLLPVVLYIVALVLVVAGGSHRAAWTVILVCGVALSLFTLYALMVSKWGELFLAPPCLAALAIVQLRYRPRTSSAEEVS